MEPLAQETGAPSVRRSWALPDGPKAVRLARRAVAATWRSWGLPGDEMVPILLTSEVVTNALKHSYSPMCLHVTRQARDRIVVEVSDPSPVPPVRCRPDVDGVGGRGLLLLDRLADEWGYRILSTGKIVWFVVTAPTRG